MRHGVGGRKLNRSSAHRKAMRRNLVQSLFEHGRVKTTLVKAKEVRAFAERLVTLAIDGSLAARQRAIALLNDRQIIPSEHRDDYDRMTDAKREKVLRARSGRRYRAATTKPGVPFTSESVIHRLFAEIGPKMKQRNESNNSQGGYTRIIKLAEPRLGDAAPTAMIELVGNDDEPRTKSSKSTRRRKAESRYGLFAGGVTSGKDAAKEKAAEETAVATAEPEADEAAGEDKDKD